MSFETLRAALKITGLPAPQKVVLLHLADFANDDREARPKIKTLAALTGLSERATHNAVNRLVEIGLITKRRSQYSSRYTVNVEGSRSARGKEPNESRYAPDAELNESRSARGAELTCTRCGSDMHEAQVRYAGGAGQTCMRCRSDMHEVQLHENHPMNQPMNQPKNPVVCDDKLVDIEIIKSIYPKRTPGHNWKQAAKALTARIRQGHTIDMLIEGTRRYAAYVAEQERTSKTWDPKYVKTASAFFGPDEHFLLDWAVETKGQRHKGNAIDVIERFSHA